MEMRGMSGELLGTIGTSTPVQESQPVEARPQLVDPRSLRSAKADCVQSPTLSPAFTAKKRKILAALHPPGSEYSDKSPKGSVDAVIVDLIEEINSYEGLVTTSSCAGRVSVFLEGEKARSVISSDDVQMNSENSEASRQTSTKVPGGKGLGGRWLFVSHEPLSKRGIEASASRSWRETFGLATDPSTVSAPAVLHGELPRFVKFAFEPLILHVLCASLKHAQPLLAAAVNAGFRESGVQSLRILAEKDGESQGVMVGIRTAGLGFESIIGYLQGGGQGQEYCQAMVTEGYLKLLVSLSEERFVANDSRRERLRKELREHMEGVKGQRSDARRWEEKEHRRQRKREEGLQRREEVKRAEERHGDVVRQHIREGLLSILPETSDMSP